MPATPNTFVTIGETPFIGESLDITVSFDNVGNIPGYGFFALLYLDSTGADGNDGLTFDSATYLGSSVKTKEVTLDDSGSATVTVFGVEQTVNIPSDFGEDDTLVLLELPYGSFVPNQPQADITVKLNGNQLADLNTPINIQTQGGFIFGETPEEETNPLDDPAILEDISGDSTDTVSPQLVTITKNYLGPEDETATGPNFLREYELVIDVADGQTITNLDITDILPNTLQFVDVVSIVDANGDPIASGNITEVVTPDDDGLTSIGLGIDDNGVGGDGIPTPGGTLTRRISSITGTSGDRDAVLTFSFFVPRVDDGSDSQPVVIDAVSGDDVISPNNAQLGDNNPGDTNNQWVPIDSRDDDPIPEVFVQPNPNADDSEHRLEDQSIAIQKTVENITGNLNSPGDILEYTIEFQISDYFAFQNIDLIDTFSDGQRFNNGFTPTLTVNEHGGTSAIANFDLSNNIIIDTSQIGNDTLTGTDGSTTVTFEVSDELITRSFDSNGILIGGGIPEGGTGTDPFPNNPTLPFGATTGTIKFQTVIQQDYSDTFPSGDSSVDAGDVLVNNAIITGELLDVTDVSTPTGQSEEDDTSTEIGISQGNLYKSIYAINGVIASGADTDNNLNNGVTGYSSGVKVSPGDTVTYRLTYELPVSDVEELQLTDYFPLPVFNIGTEFPTPTFDPTVSTTAPAAGQTKYGPLDTFSAITSAPDPTVVADGTANTLNYAYGDFDDSNNTASVVDLLVTVTAKDKPFADGLLLTNQVRQSQENTSEEVSTRDAIIQILLGQPDLNLTKGVVAFNSDTAGIAFDPTPAAPTGVTFAAPGTTDSFIGTITSAGLDTTTINSNLTGGLEAGDLVTFALVVENTGGSRAGAFDVEIADTLPDGFLIPTGGLNLQVTDGVGDAIGFAKIDGSAATDNDLFADGIQLDDSNAPTSADPDGTNGGAIDGFLTDTNGDQTNAGRNIAVITYDLEVAPGSPYTNSDSDENTPEELLNTSTLKSYANIEGGQDFPASADDANVSASVEIDAPDATKSIVTTSESSTEDVQDGTGTNNNATTGRRKLAIGEIIRYRLVARIPEGEATNFQLRDRLPNGFQFLDDGTAKAAFVSDDAPITSVTPSVSNPLNLGLGSFATFNDINSNNALWIQGSDESVVTPTFTLDDSNIGSSKHIRGNDPDPDIYTPNKDVYFKFGHINNPDRDADDEYVIVEFNALVENRTNNELSDNRKNRLSVNVGVGNNFNTERELALSNDINTRIVEPEITLDKKVNGQDTDTIPFRVDSGDLVTFTVTFSNANGVNNASAFDLVMTDTLPSELNNLQIVSVTPSDASVTGIIDNSVVGSNEIIINVDELPTGENVTVTYTADVGGTVTPDQLIDNTATVTYTSLPGNGTANGDPGNATGSTTPGASGADDGERDSSDGAGISPDDYITTDTGQLQAAPLIPTKTLVSTSEASTTSNSDVTIGEIVRYRLAVQIPEGQIPNLQLEDLLPAGMVYLNDGTTNVAFIANDGGVTSTTISGSGLQITGDAPDTPIFTLPASAIAEENPNSSFESGENPIFSLGDLTNADSDTDKEYVVIEFNALVENIAGNQDSATLDNILRVSATNATTRETDPLTINIVEPSITNVSKLASSTTGDAEDPITYTVTFTNEGNATAFEVNLTDSLPAELENLVVSSILIKDENDNDVTGSFTTTDTSTTTALDIEINQLLKDYSVEVEYTADIVNNIAPGTSIDNTASVTYSSLPGDDTDGSSSTSPGTASNPTGSDVNDTTSGDTNSERNSSSNGEGNTVNNYTDSSTEQVTVTSLNLTKSIANTSVDNNTDSNVLINEIVTYRLLVEVPEGESTSFQITDTLPNGLTYVDNTAKIALVDDNSSIESDQIERVSNPTAYQNGDETTINSITPNFSFEPPGTPLISGEDIVFNLGTVTNNDNDSDTEYIVIEFDALVDNPGDSQGSLDNVFSIGSNNSNTVNVSISQDYGDAPDTGDNSTGVGDYLTTKDNGGASHYVTDGLTIGSTVDADSGNLQNPNADADSGDEDGINSFAELKENATSYTVSIDVNNDTGGDATLVGWIDFNRNGVFESTEAVSKTVSSSNSLQNIDLQWNSSTTPIPTGANIDPGVTYARFRLSTDPALDIIDNSDSIGTLQDGEVEDYQLTIIDVNEIDGNEYSEEITGSTGDDIITGGEGQDTLTGNGGNDQFVFTKTSDGVDIIEDFDPNGDLLDFRAIMTGELATAIPFTNDPFTDGYVKAVSFGSHTMIQVDFDLNGSQEPKDVVLLRNTVAGNINAGDFIF